MLQRTELEAEQNHVYGIERELRQSYDAFISDLHQMRSSLEPDIGYDVQQPASKRRHPDIRDPCAEPK